MEGEEIPMGDLLEHAEDLTPVQLTPLLLVDQQRRWRRGERVPAETYLERHPRLRSLPELAVDLVYGEFVVREELGEAPDPWEYGRRFPDLKDDLSRQFEFRQDLARESEGAASLPHRVGRFEVRDTLGVGAFGRVFRAHDPQLGRDVALKTLHSHLHTRDHRERFLREARAAAQLRHPNLVSVHDCGVEPEGCYIAYQLVQGRTLDEALRDRSFSPDEAALLIRKLARAVHYAHARGVIHRDLKAENVLLDDEGQPYVSDFGLVRLQGEATLTMEGAILGTPAYMPPEQAEGGAHRADARSDVYSLGVILYRLLTGRLPFDGSPQSVLRKVVEEEPPRPTRVDRDIPRDLETICLKAMAKRPVERYRSAEELADDLGRWSRREPILARPSGIGERTLKWSRRRPAAAALILVTFVAVAGLVALQLAWSARNVADARTSLARSLADRARLYLEKGDTSGLLLLVQARELAEGDPDLERSLALAWSGWYAACRGRLAQVMEHDSPAVFARLGPEGRCIASAHGDDSVRVWDTSTGALQWTGTHTFGAAVGPMAFGGGGRILASVAGTEGVVLSEVSTGAPWCPPLVSPGGVAALGLAENGMTLVTNGGPLVLWNLGGKGPRETVLDPHGFQHLALSPDGSLVAGHLWDGSDRHWVQIFDVASRETRGPRIRHPDWAGISTIAFSPDGTRLATGAWDDDSARIWDRATGASVGRPLVHSGDLWDVMFSPDGKRVATASYDGTVGLWDAETGQSVGAGRRSHGGPVRAVDFSQKGDLLASGSEDTTARLWDARTGEPRSLPLRHLGYVYDVDLSADGRVLATACHDGRVRLWETGVLDPVSPVLRHPMRAWSVAFTPDGTILVSGTEDSFVRLWDTGTGYQIISSPFEQNLEVYATAFSPDGELLATGGNGVWLSRWREGEPMVQIADPQHTPTRVVAFSPDGESIAAASNAGVHVWPVKDTSRPRCLIEIDGGAVNTRVAFTKNGSLLVTGHEREVSLWETGTWRRRGSPLALDADLEALAIHPDGRWLATGLMTVGVQFWSLDDWTRVGPRLADPILAQALDFSPDGRFLATIDRGGVARVWELGNGLPVGPEYSHGGQLGRAVRFSPDGRTLATAAFDGTVRLVRLPPFEEISLEEMRLRSRVHLGLRLDGNGTAEAMPLADWKADRDRLRAIQ